MLLFLLSGGSAVVKVVLEASLFRRRASSGETSWFNERKQSEKVKKTQENVCESFQFLITTVTVWNIWRTSPALQVAVPEATKSERKKSLSCVKNVKRLEKILLLWVCVSVA